MTAQFVHVDVGGPPYPDPCWGRARLDSAPARDLSATEPLQGRSEAVLPFDGRPTFAA